MFQRGDVILITRWLNNFQSIQIYAFVLKVYNPNKAFVKILSANYNINSCLNKKELKNWKKFGITDNTGYYYYDCTNHYEQYTVINNAPNIIQSIIKTITSTNISKIITTLDQNYLCTGQTATALKINHETYKISISGINPFTYVYKIDEDIGAFNLGTDYKAEQRALAKTELYSIKTKLEKL